MAAVPERGIEAGHLLAIGEACVQSVDQGVDANAVGLKSFAADIDQQQALSVGMPVQWLDLPGAQRAVAVVVEGQRGEWCVVRLCV